MKNSKFEFNFTIIIMAIIYIIIYAYALLNDVFNFERFSYFASNKNFDLLTFIYAMLIGLPYFIGIGYIRQYFDKSKNNSEN